MTTQSIVGRRAEIDCLRKMFNSNQAEFFAIYGRRRIGKTYLVRQFAMEQKNTTYFDFTGQQNATLSEQIENFCVRMEEVFQLSVPIHRPNNWTATLVLLNSLLNKQPPRNKIFLFLDELPWIANRNSRFVSALDYIWNQYWSKNSRIKLVVCGSAASWIIDKVINAKGGLHNRVTGQLNLAPFKLDEVDSFIKQKGIKLSKNEVFKIYMAIGGVPFYWTFIEKGKSSAETIEDLFFKKASPLKDEYLRLFNSLFDNFEIHKKIVESLSTNRHGMSRTDLISKLKQKSGGQFNRYLNELIVSGFIQEFIPYGRKKKDHYFRLVDPFCFFYLKWRTEISIGKTSWMTLQGTSRMQAWLGYTFENICITLETKMQIALGLEGMVVSSSSWVYRAKSKDKEQRGVQIDLLWKRKDGIVQLFEMKYSELPFKLEKSDAKSLVEKIEVFKEKTKFHGQVFLTLVSPHGLAPGLWSEDVVDSVINLDQIW